MRCLLLHPEDDPLAGLWSEGPWDRVVDLGIAGPSTYKMWSKALGCEVEPYPSLDQLDFATLRQMHAFGLGQVVDEQGLDWWDLCCVRWLDQFVDLVLTAKFVASLASTDEIGLASERYAQVLEAVAPGRIPRIVKQRPGPKPRSPFGRLRKLSLRQLLEILGDKYDGDYKWRRLIAPARANCRRPVVLLPSAYGNASRTALVLAASLPNQEFLLVGTRRSARVDSLPQNTKWAWLSSYATGQPGQDEIRGLLSRWERLRESLTGHAELKLLRGMGCFDTFPAHVQEGLAIRDCWTSVLDGEPIVSVLCADEKNPYTRIPVLLAQKRGIPTVACHHGALDGRYLFTDVCADQFLAKSEMEWDYLVNLCRMSEEVVRVASGPRVPFDGCQATRGGNAIVFFSEPYEAFNGRTREVYAEVLPGLSRLAKHHSRQLIIKLHPFENLRECKRIADLVLSRGDRSNLKFVTGPLSKELVGDAWFSVTVSSSAAVDCATQGVPAFLCLWLDRYGFGYGEQFVKFGAALPLRAAEQISEIPSRLRDFAKQTVGDSSSNLDPELLRKMLFPNAVASYASNAGREEEKMWA